VAAACEFVEVEPLHRIVFTWGWTHDHVVAAGTHPRRGDLRGGGRRHPRRATHHGLPRSARPQRHVAARGQQPPSGGGSFPARLLATYSRVSRPDGPAARVAQQGCTARITDISGRPLAVALRLIGPLGR
jgi:hypothetical protein